MIWNQYRIKPFGTKEDWISGILYTLIFFVITKSLTQSLVTSDLLRFNLTVACCVIGLTVLNPFMPPMVIILNRKKLKLQNYLGIGIHKISYGEIASVQEVDIPDRDMDGLLWRPRQKAWRDGSGEFRSFVRKGTDCFWIYMKDGKRYLFSSYNRSVVIYEIGKRIASNKSED